MTGGSLDMALRAPSLRLQRSFSVVSCWSVVPKKTVSSCAMTVDSMFTSISFAGMSSLIFNTIFFRLDSFLIAIKNLLACSFSLQCVQ